MNDRGAARRAAFVRWRSILSILFTLLVVFSASSARAQHEENSVRAAFVFNLTKYVEWPHLHKELVVGYLGDGDMGDILQKVITGKNSGARTIRVVIAPTDDQLSQCDIVYIAYSSPKKTHSVLDKVRNKNILSVGETDSFARDGGMVGLVLVGDHIQIEVNLESVQSGGLKISSRLLNLAEIVRAGKRG